MAEDQPTIISNMLNEAVAGKHAAALPRRARWNGEAITLTFG